MEQYTGFSANASLVLIAEWTKSNYIWDELAAKVHISQKTIKHSPHEKLKDLLINMWAAGATKPRSSAWPGNWKRRSPGRIGYRRGIDLKDLTCFTRSVIN